MIDTEKELANIQPYIMLIEDREKSRKNTSDLLTEMGCTVIAVGNLNDALKQYISTPNIDLVFTDIDLSSSPNEGDKSGVEIARFIKHLDRELPVIGYSSKFADNELSEDDKSFFDAWYSKGSLSIQPLMEMYSELKLQAIAYNQKKTNRLRPFLKEKPEKDGSAGVALLDVIKGIKKHEDESIKRVFDEFKEFALQEGKYNNEKSNKGDQINQIHDMNRRLYLAEYKLEIFKGHIDKVSEDNTVHVLDLRLTTLETLLKNIESKMELQATKTFWYYFISLIGILGGITGIIALVLRLLGK